jgi:hypothetical protein
LALKGTLKDFGIAEILQLIGQQAKSGVLHLKNKDDEIHIQMAEGSVVSAECTTRKAKEKLGELLVRAGLMTRGELDFALEAQQRTLRRLGDVLVEHGTISREDLREMTALQTTETVYRLFQWKSGTYEFEPGEVEWSRDTVVPLRAESVLMEGFRQVDEWPMIRRKISSTAMTFERLRDPDARPKTVTKSFAGGKKSRKSKEVDGEVAASGALGLGGPEEKAEFASLGPNEWRVYQLAVPGQTVEKIVDLSRLGEFEACKSLVNLVNLDILRPLPPPKRTAAHEVGAYARDWQQRIRRGAARVATTIALAAVLAALGYYVNEQGFAWADPSGGRALYDNAAQRFLARTQIARLGGALEVYRLERGEYPERLEALVEAGLASRRDLRYPWSGTYYYRRKAEGGYVLLPPVE